jgi:hypothetical protein
MTRYYVVEQRMSKSTWEYRNTFDTTQEAVQFIIDHHSATYPHRILRQTNDVIFIEGISTTLKRTKKNDSKRTRKKTT